jgi:hypothetical protein
MVGRRGHEVSAAARLRRAALELRAGRAGHAPHLRLRRGSV